jgi:hypothetical protein
LKPDVYLRQNAMVEPLFNQWYAWPYLVSPVTAPMYVGNLHLRLMESFVANPQIHIAALKNPEMAGGPFLSFDESKVGAVAQLVEKTRRQSAALLEFADAVRELTGILTTRADGASLLPFYPDVPEALRGYVELVYDVNHHPSIRFLEPLLYRSPAYDEAAQSLDFSVVEEDDRPFVFSTPRLGGHRLRLPLPYRAEASTRCSECGSARSLGFAKEALGISGPWTRGSSLFTDRAPRPAQAHAGSGVGSATSVTPACSSRRRTRRS